MALITFTTGSTTGAFLHLEPEVMATLAENFPLPSTPDSHLASNAFWANLAEFFPAINRNAINTWFRPGSSMSRMGLFRGLVSTANKEILESAHSTTLKITDGTVEISETMYPTLYQQVNNGDMWLVTLVDGRANLQSTPLPLATWADTYSWTSFLTEVLSGLVTYSFETAVESVYKQPDPDSPLCSRRSAAIVIDLAGWSTGRIACYKRDGTVVFRKMSALPSVSDYAVSGIGSPRLPSTITSLFPRWDNTTGWVYIEGNGSSYIYDNRVVVSNSYDLATELPSLATQVGDWPLTLSFTTKNVGASITADNAALADAISEQLAYYISSSGYARLTGIQDIDDDSGLDVIWSVTTDSVETLIIKAESDFPVVFCNRTEATIPSYPSGSGSGFTLTDGTNTVTGTTQVTVTDMTVGGATPNATLAPNETSYTQKGTVNLSAQDMGRGKKTFDDLSTRNGVEFKPLASSTASTIITGVTGGGNADLRLYHGAIIRLSRLTPDPTYGSAYTSISGLEFESTTTGAGTGWRPLFYDYGLAGEPIDTNINYNTPEYPSGAGDVRFRLLGTYCASAGFRRHLAFIEGDPASTSFASTEVTAKYTLWNFGRFISSGGYQTLDSSYNLVTGSTGTGYTSVNVVNGLVTGGSTGGGGAPTNATYVTLSTDATLTNERVLTAGTGISITDGGAGGNVTISATGTGAPTNAQYVTLALDGTLTNERVLTAGTNITIVDGGANNPVTLSSPTGGTGTNVVGDTITAGHTAAVGTGLTRIEAVLPVSPVNIFVGPGYTATGLTFNIPATGRYDFIGKIRMYMISGGGGYSYMVGAIFRNGVLIASSPAMYYVLLGAGQNIQDTVPLHCQSVACTAGDVITVQANWQGAGLALSQVLSDAAGFTELSAIRTGS